MKVIVFMGCNADDLQAQINSWLRINNNRIKVKHVTQSESADLNENFSVTISVWYELI